MRAVSSHRVRKFVARWDLPFALFTVLLYTPMLPVLWFVFPDVSNLWVSIFVIFGTWTSSVSSLATLLKEREPDDDS